MGKQHLTEFLRQLFALLILYGKCYVFQTQALQLFYPRLSAFQRNQRGTQRYDADQSKDIVNALRRKLQQLHVDLWLNTTAKEILVGNQRGTQRYDGMAGFLGKTIPIPSRTGARIGRAAGGHNDMFRIQFVSIQQLYAHSGAK